MEQPEVLAIGEKPNNEANFMKWPYILVLWDAVHWMSMLQGLIDST